MRGAAPYCCLPHFPCAPHPAGRRGRCRRAAWQRRPCLGRPRPACQGQPHPERGQHGQLHHGGRRAGLPLLLQVHRHAARHAGHAGDDGRDARVLPAAAALCAPVWAAHVRAGGARWSWGRGRWAGRHCRNAWTQRARWHAAGLQPRMPERRPLHHPTQRAPLPPAPAPPPVRASSTHAHTPQIAEHATGRVGRVLLEICICASNLGCIVAFLNILADTLSSVAGTLIPPSVEPSRGTYMMGALGGCGRGRRGAGTAGGSLLADIALTWTGGQGLATHVHCVCRPAP